MSRTFAALLLQAPVIAGFALLAAGCGATPPEQQVINSFFRAARVRDNATLANLAAVSFDPRTQGTVQDFEVVNPGEEQRRTLQIRQLMEEEEKAIQDDAEFAKRKKEYQDANLEAIERVVKAERSQATVRGRDAEVQAAWTKWREEQGQYQKRLSDVRSRLANERALAVNSLTPPGQADFDVSDMEVELVTKQVTINAEVREPSGTTTPKMLVFTLQKAVGKGADGERDGRWIITSIREQDAAAPATN
ncbi:MAG: hypothetical protein ACRD26_13520 [Vicinamibacterales bacterium]